MVAAQSWTERKAGRRDWEIVLACILAFLWIWDVWNRNRTPGSDNHRSSACEMAVDFFVGCRREAENVCRKFSSSLNLQRRIHSWNCNQNCLSNISVASCRIARLYHSKCLFLLLVLQPELSEQYFCSLWHTECLFFAVLFDLQPELSHNAAAATVMFWRRRKKIAIGSVLRLDHAHLHHN